MSDVETMTGEWVARIEAARDLQSLELERVAALGKQGAITGLLKTLGGMTPEERQVEGPRIHSLRETVTEAIAARKAALETAELDRKLANETLDMSLPVSDGEGAEERRGRKACVSTGSSRWCADHKKKKIKHQRTK